MNTILVVCLYLLLIWAAFIALYNGLIRPAVLMRLRFLIFECRDDVRGLVIEKSLTEQDEEYLIVERGCQRALAVLGKPNLLDVLAYKPSQETKLRVEKDMKVIENAKLQVRKIHRQLNHAMIGAVFLNSPGLFPLLAFCGVLAICFYWFGRARKVISDSSMKAWGLVYDGGCLAH